jgi:hypothetical protein
MGTFLSWLHNNSYKDSLEDQELFVLPNALVPETVDPMNPQIKIVAVLSTRALLRNIIRQQHTSMPSFLSCDGTYSLLENGWPTPVFGTVDWNHKFRCVAIGFCTNEDKGTFARCLQCIQQGQATQM